MALTLDPAPRYDRGETAEQYLERSGDWLQDIGEKVTQVVADGNAATGDLGGTYPDPVVVGLRGLGLASPVADEFVKVNAGATAYEGVSYGSAANTVCEGDDARLSDTRDPNAHAASHETGGPDEMSVDGMSGVLADLQNPVLHAAAHENGGGDEMSVDGLSGQLADDQNPVDHATDHESGGVDQIDLNDLRWTGANGEFVRRLWGSERLAGLSGASVSTTGLIPAGAFNCFAVLFIEEAITGATTFDIGDGTDVDKWGAAFGVSAPNSSISSDWTAAPGFYPAGGDVVLTANGSNFTGGIVRIAVCYELSTGPTG